MRSGVTRPSPCRKDNLPKSSILPVSCVIGAARYRKLNFPRLHAVDTTSQRLTLNATYRLLDGQEIEPRVALAAMPGVVGRDEGVRTGEQGMVQRQWFLLKDVDPRCSKPAGLERLDKRLCLDHRSPRGIDQDRRRFHPPQPLRVQEMPGFRGESDMQRQNIGLGQ